MTHVSFHSGNFFFFFCMILKEDGTALALYEASLSCTRLFILKALEQKYLPNNFNNISNKPCWQETEWAVSSSPWCPRIPLGRDVFRALVYFQRDFKHIVMHWMTLTLYYNYLLLYTRRFTSVQSWQLFTKLTTCERITQQAGNKEDGGQQYIVHC